MKDANTKAGYDNDSITSLKGAERVRKRPAVIFGSDGIEGCQHSIFEILSNSIDEARQGFGNKIEIIRHTDKSVTVTDYGRGIPVEYNEKEGKFNWELIFCELYAGGKFINNDEDANYSFSLGLNGLGLCATQYSSEYMNVAVRRDRQVFTLRFEKGENVGGLHKKSLDSEAAIIAAGNSGPTGTSITWRPDIEVFTDINVPLDYFLETIKRQAIVNAGLTFELVDEYTGESYSFLYENGIQDYLNELCAAPLTQPQFWECDTKGRDREDKPEYKLKFQIAFCFNSEVNKTEYFHNSSFLEHGGSPDKAVRSAFVCAVDSYIKTGNGSGNAIYKKDEKKIAYTDVEDSLVLISNSFSTITSYENQTKKSITNRFIQEAMTDFLKKRLEIYFIENKSDADKIAAQVLVNKRSRELAEKTRLSIKKKLTGAIDINNRVEKFVNCRTKNVERRELYIVEGDSALGSCKMGRDAEFQAIMPVRGKILNCLKADYKKILNNEIITDLLRVLGCGVEIRSKHSELNSFDLSQLKWSKIIICTDADVDGFQIRTLILTMLYSLVPTLIDEKKVFIAESPLYEITAHKKIFFAYSDKEKNDIVKKLSGKYSIQRSKGLGENEPEMMWQTTMNPETRKLIMVLPDEAQHAREIFEMLLGDNLRGRKEHIEQVGHKYIDLSETV
ncbi:MAG: DNA topoisomerase [Clostridiales bacterium]|jgi:DNA gyrase subunit B|nr:DNA topoisomerase [Clostridiales bacterium]